MKRAPLARAAYCAAGTVFVAIGIAGVILPLLPATPFFLLAAACYLRGSQRAYDWLLAHRVFGAGIRAFREGRGISRRAKAAALATMWASLGVSMHVAGSLGAVAALAAIGGSVTFFLLRLSSA